MDLRDCCPRPSSRLGAGGYYFMRTRTVPAPAEVRSATDQAVAPAAPVRPLPEAGETIDLPPIDQTDAIVRELVARLSSHPTIAAWLTTDHLIRNFTAVVDNIANGLTPSGHLGKVRPAGELPGPRGSRQCVDRRPFVPPLRQVRRRRRRPRCPRRREALCDAPAAPGRRLPRAGPPGREFRPGIRAGVIELLKTPVIDGDIALTSKSVAYEFADPRLQSLSSAQRQFLRMGPRNVRLIQAKLREIAPFVGIAPESLPR